LVINVESSTMPKKSKRVKKEKTNFEKRKKIVDDVVMHKNPKDFNKAKCKTID
jgi:hypothetical protein